MNSPDDNSRSESTSDRSVLEEPTFFGRNAHLFCFLLFNPLLIAYAIYKEEIYPLLFPSFLGFAFAQAVLIGFWCSFSNLRWWIKWPTTIVLTVILICQSLFRDSWCIWREDFSDEEMLYFSTVVFTILIGNLIKPMLGGVQNWSSEIQTERHRQVSILQLFGWMTFISLIIAYVKFRWPVYMANNLGPDFGFLMGGIAAALGIVCCSVFFSRKPIIASLIGLLFALIAGILSLYLVHGPGLVTSSNMLWHFGPIYVAEAGMLLATIWIAKWAGLQPTWKGSDSKVAVPEDNDLRAEGFG